MAEEGDCRLCLLFGPLSREHSPPQGSGNSGRIVRKDALRYLQDPSTEAGRIFQNGVWTYSLCEGCNNHLGALYVPEYVRWAKWFLHEYRLWSEGIVPVYLERVFPLRFLKQAVAMIFSVNGMEFARGFHSLAEWILDRHAYGWHWEPRVYLTLADGEIGRGWNILYRGGKDPAMLTEIAFRPFSVQLVLQEERTDRPGNITHFARYRHDDVADVSMPLPCGSLASGVPAQFSSREEVERARARATQRREEKREGP